MKHTTTNRTLLSFWLLSISGAALAHPGHAATGFSAGLMHPFTGMDHLLTMFAIGLWATQMSGRKIWLLPATFTFMLIAGAGLSLVYQSLPLLEPGIAVSVLTLGLLIALSLRLPVLLSASITAMFGLLHGYAHGLEMPGASAPVAYALGFLITTAILHMIGIGVGVATRARFIQALGVAIAFSGIWMLG